MAVQEVTRRQFRSRTTFAFSITTKLLTLLSSGDMFYESQTSSKIKALHPFWYSAHIRRCCAFIVTYKSCLTDAIFKQHIFKINIKDHLFLMNQLWKCGLIGPNIFILQILHLDNGKDYPNIALTTLFIEEINSLHSIARQCSSKESHALVMSSKILTYGLMTIS